MFIGSIWAAISLAFGTKYIGDRVSSILGCNSVMWGTSGLLKDCGSYKSSCITEIVLDKSGGNSIPIKYRGFMNLLYL